MKSFKEYLNVNESMSDADKDFLSDNETRALYYKIADVLPKLISNLKIGSNRKSSLAAKELKIFQDMKSALDKSSLGKLL